MKKAVLFIFALILGLNIHAQSQRRNTRNTNNIPQTNREPSEQEIAKREREIEERKEEYIDNFISTLEADEFQKHIVKQTLTSFFEEKLAIFKIRFEHSIDREKVVENLENAHFKDLEELISEDDMSKVKKLIKGDFDEKEVVKKKKKEKA
tara:strand:+ start:1797 stop:2249 length:453 start_codon:yes stop_codon:yes gene_type:complete